MRRTVLLVDDEPNIVLSLEFLVEQAGYEARVARDGESALKAIEERKPDLVLLDVMLPKRDGFDVCRRIRANPEWNDIRMRGRLHHQTVLHPRGHGADQALPGR
jgi:DNA-binding response OmpR family regulator